MCNPLVWKVTFAAKKIDQNYFFKTYSFIQLFIWNFAWENERSFDTSNLFWKCDSADGIDLFANLNRTFTYVWGKIGVSASKWSLKWRGGEKKMIKVCVTLCITRPQSDLWAEFTRKSVLTKRKNLLENSKAFTVRFNILETQHCFSYH